MNFEFSAETEELRAHAKRFLGAKSPPSAARRVLEGQIPYDWDLWHEISQLGWQGVSIPEEFGGFGLPAEQLCVLAEELGASVNSTAFSSSVYLASNAILLGGGGRQKSAYLPRLAEGTTIGCLAWNEGSGEPELELVGCSVSEDGRLTGVKFPVLDGMVAQLGVILALDSQALPAFYVVDLEGEGVRRQAMASIDPSRNLASLSFNGAPAERLECDARVLMRQLLDRAAVLYAFEQIGGGAACLRLACEYANERRSFGRRIGSYQAVKHGLARAYVAVELARSNAYYATMALERGAGDSTQASCAARIAASQAFELAAATALQVHGGMGFTWESDCHLYLRRAKLLSLCLGSTGWWRERLSLCLMNGHGAHHGS